MTKDKKTQFVGITERLGLLPQEMPVLSNTKKGRLFIGLPKERTFDENRIGLSPEAVEVLIANGHNVLIESKAGEASGFTNHMYSEVGATIAQSTEEVFKADILVKVAPPTLFEIDLMKPGQSLISPIHLPTISKQYLYALMSKKVNAIAFEFVKNKSNNYPFVTAMSEIAGNSAISIAAELLSKSKDGKGVLLGGISGVPCTKVVIIGAGVVGTFSARAALGLGAQVSIFDSDISKLAQIQNNLNTPVFNSIITPEVLLKELKQADVAIGAIHSERGRSPIVVTENMISKMKPGSVILDISIDQGGCFETSKLTTLENPYFIYEDIIHYCVPNIPSRVPQTASYALSHIITPILFNAFEVGGMNQLIRYDKGLCNGVYTYNGHLTEQYLANKFDIKYTNLGLVFGADA